MFAIGGAILGLGESPSSFGTTLALLITFILVLGGLVNALIAYIIAQVANEHRDNQERMRNTPE